MIVLAITIYLLNYLAAKPFRRPIFCFFIDLDLDLNFALTLDHHKISLEVEAKFNPRCLR